MAEEWQVSEGAGWIDIPGFGRLNPRRDNVGGGRQYFDAMTDAGGYAEVKGDTITGGPETYNFEFDQEFWLRDGEGQVLEVTISLLQGGRYAVKYRPGDWPLQSPGGW